MRHRAFGPGFYAARDNSDMRAHHIWWFTRLPKTPGETDGVSNNWWEYVLDPNLVR